MLGHEIEGENQLLELPTGIRDMHAYKRIYHKYVLMCYSYQLNGLDMRKSQH